MIDIQCESKNLPGVFWHIFTNGWEFLINFTHQKYVPIYASLQIFVQLSPTWTKLCHIKRDYLVHIICSKCSPSAETHAFRRLRKSLIALLIVVCDKSSQICCSVLLSPEMVFGFDWSFWNVWSIAPPHMVVEWLRSGEFDGHWSFAMKSVQFTFTHSCVWRAMWAGAPSC